MAIREATDRVRKSTPEMKAAMRGKCKTPGCNSHLTLWKGPGEKEYCDPCQRNFAAFGGMATPSKAYSQLRQTSCSDCGFDPAKLPRVKKYKESDPKKYNSLLRAALTVDHIDGNHENNEPDNLVTLCSNCHNIKTIEYGDNLTPSNQNIL
jgi:5-methylcytosine-specific restriction endonuclease McrA